MEGRIDYLQGAPRCQEFDYQRYPTYDTALPDLGSTDGLATVPVEPGPTLSTCSWVPTPLFEGGFSGPEMILSQTIRYLHATRFNV